LLLARELLIKSGSIFVQISDENLHHVRELMDEVFGANNSVSDIYYARTGRFATEALSRDGNGLIWGEAFWLQEHSKPGLCEGAHAF
jgi:adenine-specific DNA-methyltransferase